jgi:hypothetical protein
MVHLGDRDIVLESEHVLLLPGRIGSWLGQEGVMVAYTAIVDASLDGPPGSRWTIRLRGGVELAVGFRRREAERMESIHHEVLVRALGAQFSQL